MDSSEGLSYPGRMIFRGKTASLTGPGSWLAGLLLCTVCLDCARSGFGPSSALAPEATCPAGQSCDVDCQEESCEFDCLEAAQCRLGCLGETCLVRCAAGARCEVDCRARTCRVECTNAAACSMVGPCQASCQGACTLSASPDLGCSSQSSLGP